MTEPTWKPIAGFEEQYEVSDHGVVRSVADQQPLKQYVANKSGHLRVVLKRPEGGRLQQYVHRLLLAAFVGPCPDGHECCHNDGNGSNNHVTNLRWDTASSNMYDKVKHGVHHHANRTHCPKGHLLDAVKRHSDGSFWQRRCRTCLREENRERERAKWAQVDTCPKGHPLDGVSTWADGSPRGRYCKTCRTENVSRQMTQRHAKARAEKTRCDNGHELDGERVRPSGAVYRWCRKCANEQQRLKKAQR